MKLDQLAVQLQGLNRERAVLESRGIWRAAWAGKP
jgi:hypothetical protein